MSVVCHTWSPWFRNTRYMYIFYGDIKQWPVTNGIIIHSPSLPRNMTWTMYLGSWSCLEPSSSVQQALHPEFLEWMQRWIIFWAPSHHRSPPKHHHAEQFMSFYLFPIPSDPRYKRDRSENIQNVTPFTRMCGYRVNIALKQGNLWVVVQLLAGVWTESCTFDEKGTRCSALKQLTWLLQGFVC